MKRFGIDHQGLAIARVIVSGTLKVQNEYAKMRARYKIACAEIGEPPLRDHHKDAGHWAQQRAVEASMGVGGHRSDVRVVFEHQELWGISNTEELVKRIKGVLTGIDEEVGKARYE